MSQTKPLSLRRSEMYQTWEKALRETDHTLLKKLVRDDDPVAALLTLESFINGTYRASQHPLFSGSLADLRAQISQVLPYVNEIRIRLGWRVREFDLALLCMIRRSSALSAVLGAGVSVGAGAPSWPDLVRQMLEETLDKGLEFYKSIPDANNPSQPPIEFLPDGTVRTGGTGSWRFEQKVSHVKRYTTEQEQTGRKILADVQTQGSKTDVEVLMRGAQLCYDLCGQHLFRLLTKLLYSKAKEPSQTHKAIAELAPLQVVPDRGPGMFPGWESIITYNIDALMSEAFAQQQIPHAAWAMKGDGLRGDPDKLAREDTWYLPIYHLHGYTPRRLFLITDVRFVFSTSQYEGTYKGDPSAILAVVYNKYLCNPVHIALYIGCSFVDKEMNNILSKAFAEYPGRYHYALLQWPHARNGKEPTANEIAAESSKYLQFGVRPVWFDKFDEIPGMIRQLQ